MDTRFLYESLTDKKYLEFVKALSPSDKLPRMGISIPKIRKLSKDISPNEIAINYHEDVILKGFAIANQHSRFEDKANMLDELLPYLSSWDHTDTIQGAFKPCKINKDEMFEYFSSLLSCKELFTRRLGIVWLMSNRQKIDWNQALDLIINADSDEYYISMAVAWALSMFYFDDNSILQRFDEVSENTKKRAIQKIKESRRYKGEPL